MDQTFAAVSPDPLEGRPEPDSAAPPPRPSSTAGWLGALARTARIDASPERIFPSCWMPSRPSARTRRP